MDIVKRAYLQTYEELKGDPLLYPCPFLNTEISHCRIYDRRPFICAVYPLQFGAQFQETPALALSSYCPESLRVFRQIYLYRWHLHRAVQRLGKRMS